MQIIAIVTPSKIPDACGVPPVRVVWNLRLAALHCACAARGKHCFHCGDSTDAAKPICSGSGGTVVGDRTRCAVGGRADRVRIGSR